MVNKNRKEKRRSARQAKKSHSKYYEVDNKKDDRVARNLALAQKLEESNTFVLSSEEQESVELKIRRCRVK